ncbi:MAG TPA: hypothetical protein VGP42_16510 [Stellaceae bacterium]|jgi:hypothetical protein|nr:hypothetical protein [Stellaceae bacterium]
MFKRKKKLAPPLSPVRAVLVQADAALSDGREHLAEAEQRVVRLREIIADEVPAREARQQAVAADPDALARFGGGEKPARITALIESAENAARAATAAREAMPRAEEVLRQASEALGQLVEARRRAVDEVLIAEADAVGVEYAAAIERVMALYERLHGIDAAVGGKLAFAAPEPQEMPRFRLRSLPARPVRQLDGNLGTMFSPFIRVVPDNKRIAGHAIAWGRAVSALVDNPHVDISGLAMADAVELPSSSESGLIRHDKRPAAQETPGFVEMLVYEGTTALVPVVPDHDMSKRTRRHQVLGGDAA